MVKIRERLVMLFNIFNKISLRSLQRKRMVKVQKEFSGKTRCGNDYGGFDVILDGGGVNVKNNDLIVYSFGIGEDLSFSEDIDRNFTAQIYAFDPTPKSIKYVKDHYLYKQSNFHFIEKGIAAKDGFAHFHLPENEEYVSGSLVKHSGVRSDYIEVELCKLKSFMDILGHEKIDILKMDIEGSEFEVIEDILRDGVMFSELCLEVHDYFFENGNKKLKALITALNQDGYYIGSVKGEHELTFVKV